MAQLRQDYPKFVERETEVVVVGPEGPAEFREYWEEQSLPFTGLPDPDHKVLNRYGQQVNWIKLGRMPAQAIIDRQGMIRYLHYGSSMSDIPTTREMLSILDEINRDAVQSEAKRRETNA